MANKPSCEIQSTLLCGPLLSCNYFVSVTCGCEADEEEGGPEVGSLEREVVVVG